jgi:DNA primase
MAGKSNGRVEALHAALESGVAALTTSDDWRKWLTVQARFHNYSFGNTLLILAQCPNATNVAGYRTWQSLGRQVRKGEKSIGILAPMFAKDKESKNDDKRLIGFRAVSVFDVSQTEGEPLPVRQTAALLDGDAPAGLFDSVAALIANNGFRLERGDCGSANGYCDFTNRVIRVRNDVSDAQAAKTIIHEAAHMLMHDADNSDAPAHRGLAEVEAESVAFIVAGFMGMPTDSYSFPYVAGWAGSAESDAVRATGQRVQRTARKIIDAVAPDAG